MSRLSHVRDSFLILAVSGVLAGSVPAWGAIDTYGLNLSNGAGSSLGTFDPSREWGIRFTADESVVIDRALTYLNVVIGSPTLQIAIQADDGSGNPSGVDLATGSVLPTASGDYTTVNLTPTALTSGNVYHMIHRVPNGDGSNGVLIRSTAGVAQSHANTGRPEGNYALTFRQNPGDAWTKYVNTDVLSWGVYNSTTDQAIGQPYAHGSFVQIGQDIWQGQSFTFTGWGSKNAVDEVGLKVYKGSANVADDLRVYLVDTTTNSSIWSDVLVDKDAPVTGGAGDIFTVSVPDVELVQGRQYVLAVESIGTTAGGYELVLNNASGPTPLFQENFQYALESQYVRAFSIGLPAGGFSGQDSLNFNRDAYFTIHLVPEPAALSLLAVGALAMGRRRYSTIVN